MRALQGRECTRDPIRPPHPPSNEQHCAHRVEGSNHEEGNDDEDDEEEAPVDDDDEEEAPVDDDDDDEDDDTGSARTLGPSDSR